jgi:translation initiation factor IF-2
MSKLLFKVAKELNVGTNTIVEHLNKKGFDIDNKPNAKVTDDMFTELSKQFQASVAEKEKADQIVIGSRPMQQQQPQPKKEIPVPIIKRDKPVLGFLQPTATTPPPPVKQEAVVEKPRVEETPKVETPVERPQPVAPAPEVVQKPKVVAPSLFDTPTTTEQPVDKDFIERPKHELRGTKVLGKIDLDKKKPAPAPQTPQKPQQQQQPRRDNNNNRQDQNNNRPRPQHEQPRQQQPAKPVEQPKVIVKVEPIIIPEKIELKSNEPDMYRADTPTLKGLKILGKIDTNKFEKPVRKKEKDKKVFNQKPGVPGAKPVGAAGATSAEDEAKKRKRKRKKVTPGPITQDSIKQIGQGTGQNRGPGGQGGPRPAGQGTGQNRGPGGQGGPRPAGQGTGQNRGPGGQGGPRPAGQGTGQNRGPIRPGQNTGTNRSDQPKEVSQKEIEDKIKATMARLSGGGKNKRQKIRRDKRIDRNDRRDKQIIADGEVKMLQLAEFVTVSELASLMDVPVTDIIMTCMNLGVMVSINQRLDAEIIEFVASEFGHEVQFISAEDQVETIDEEPDAEEDLVSRAPIVTVMGHVDHGKTSLLDYIRKANVASGEAGGITQHIGAYEVKLDNGKRITFLDTPGHEAFTAMRARGAKVTDVAVIIVAADDNIMPQTREAIAHAQAAQVPIIFAINKIDKPGADPERIKNELAQMNFLVEEWGGKYQSQDISAKKGVNIDLLLEKILLEAELLDLKANPNKRAGGTVVEASLDKGRGYVTKLLVQEGTLEEGNPVVAGEFSGRIRAMFNERGQRVKKAGPSTPVLVLGLGGAPQAGEKFRVAANESEARQVASKRAQISREQANRASKRISLDEIGRRLALGSFKELNLIVKGDVDGSVEALADSLIKQSVASIQVNVIHKAVGQIIESDVLLASASDAIIIGFQVRPSLGARKIAERDGVEIKMYSVIYEAIDEIRAAMEGMLEPTKEEKETAQVEVREVYKISKVGTIAGCYVQEGKLFRNNFIRVVRDGIVVFPNREGQNGKMSSLKRYKDDMKEVRHQMECGIMIDGFNDIQVGDIIEAYEIIEVKQKLK